MPAAGSLQPTSPLSLPEPISPVAGPSIAMSYGDDPNDRLLEAIEEDVRRMRHHTRTSDSVLGELTDLGKSPQ